MPTECSPELFEFARVEGRAVVASFDGGRMTSDAGALLLGAANRVIGLTRKLAACFTDLRNPAFIEHEVETLVMQRIVGGIQIERDLLGGGLVRLQEDVDEQLLDGGCIRRQPGIARRLGAAQFQPVECALARQRGTIAAAGGKLPGQRCQHRVMA